MQVQALFQDKLRVDIVQLENEMKPLSPNQQAASSSTGDLLSQLLSEK